MAKKKVQSFDLNKRRSLIELKNKDLSQRDQCTLLGISRSGLYYEPKKPSKEDLLLMRAIDEQYLKTPFYGRRRMTIVMKEQGFLFGHKKIRTTMQTMGLEAIYPKPKLSASHPEHKKYPYLLRYKKISRPNQVWAADITYIPLHEGFGYLFAIIDWYSRYVIEWQLSNTLDADFCLEAIDRALLEEKPEIFNTDQGVQFTSQRFTEVLEKKDILISMDGKGRVFDNIMVERLWRSVKYEDIYPKGYEMLPIANQGLGMYFPFYNEERPHQGLQYQRPVEVYHENQ